MPSDDFLIDFEEDSAAVIDAGDEPTFVGLAEAVQLLVQTEQNWTIHVANEAGMSGVVGTRPGRVCYARAGTSKGEEAFCQLMAWSGGRIERQTTATQPDEIETDLPKLLMEAYWYAIEHRGERQELARTIEIEASHLSRQGVVELAPAILAKIAELEGVEGFLGVNVYKGDQIVFESGDEGSSAAAIYTAMLEMWRALDSDIEDSVLRLPHQIHIVRRIS